MTPGNKCPAVKPVGWVDAFINVTNKMAGECNIQPRKKHIEHEIQNRFSGFNSNRNVALSCLRNEQHTILVHTYETQSSTMKSAKVVCYNSIKLFS